MPPGDFAQRIIDTLNEAAEEWGQELEEMPHLRGFYLCADFETLADEDVFQAISASGSGGSVPEWTVKGWLHHALDFEMFGSVERTLDITDTIEGDEEEE